MAPDVTTPTTETALPQFSRIWEKVKDRLPFIRKGGSAIMDQGLFAGTNFIVNVLLARMLLDVQYGAFATTYAIFLLMGSLYIAMIIEPMLVFGSGKFAERFSRYLGVMTFNQTVLTVLLSIILLVVAFFFQETGQMLMSEAMLGMAIAQPFILLQWTLRRAFYVKSQPHWAATGGFLYFVLLVGGVVLMSIAGIKSTFLALVIMGGASLIVSIYFMFLLKPQLFSRPDDISRKMVLVDHFKYGRWSVSTMFLTWIPNNIYYTVLPLVVGLQGSGALRASTNLIMPILQANSAMSVLIAPMLVRALKNDGVDKMHERTRLGLMIFSLTSGIYWFILVIFGTQIFDILYDGQYNEYVSVPVLVIMGLIPFTHGAGEILSGALRAMGHLNNIFKAHLASGLVTLLVTGVLLVAPGVTGAFIGLLLSSMTAAAVIYVLYQKGRNELTDDRIREMHFYDEGENDQPDLEPSAIAAPQPDTDDGGLAPAQA